MDHSLRSLGHGRSILSLVHVVFGDQLNRQCPVISDLPKNSVVLMVEVSSASTMPVSHYQRTLLFLSAMRAFAQELTEYGQRVHYVRITDADNTHTFQDEIVRCSRLIGATSISCVRPGSHQALTSVQDAASALQIPFQLHEDSHFFDTPQGFNQWADGRKELRLEYYYRELRKKTGILMDSPKEPSGGAWNFDSENRKPWRGSNSDLPVPVSLPEDQIVAEVRKDLALALPDLPGNQHGFRWPVTPAAANHHLQDFIQNRLPRFGDYQDAIVAGQPFMHHGLLSSSLNLKLLNPRDVVAAALDAYNKGAAPINSVEGFIRQILGWREFIRGVYWREGPLYQDRNALHHTGSLPEWFWTADTDMKCQSDAIDPVLEYGYSHHIQRLMITGNFALTSGMNPKAVSDWFLGMFVDGVEWVTEPNVIGMALHADGGIVGSKPYASTGRYVKKMSDCCKTCRYKPEVKSGPEACPMSVMYWDFFMCHEERFTRNARMFHIKRNLERFDDQERSQIKYAATELRKSLGLAGETP